MGAVAKPRTRHKGLKVDKGLKVKGPKGYKSFKSAKKKKKGKTKKKIHGVQSQIVQLELDLVTAQQLLYALTHAIGGDYYKYKKKKKGKNKKKGKFGARKIQVKIRR